MKHMTLEQIASACGGQYQGPQEARKLEITGAVTDSRQIQLGYLFIPVRGARVDGHTFIPQVFTQGAVATLTEEPLENCPGPYILVESCLQALKAIAAYHRSCLKIPVVGITGSVGKTSTKEMIAAVLSARYVVHKTAGNLNNEIGLPLTILGIGEQHQAAVVEMGISEFGEMSRLAEIAKPDVCVITNIGECHLENLGDRDGVLKAKTEVFDWLAPEAHVLLNGDDDKLQTVTSAAGHKPIFYGMSSELAIHMTQLKPLGFEGTKGILRTPQGALEVQIPVPGEHHVYNAMAAAGVGLCLGLSLEEIRLGLAQARTIAGRSNILKTGGITVIDDCYNANPISMRASLNLLRQASGRKLAVLGDMGELGTREDEFHYQVGVYAVQAGVDILFCIGERSAEMAQGAREAGDQGYKKAPQVLWTATLSEMLPKLQKELRSGDTVLVKASHFMEFSKVVSALTDNQN